MTPPKKGGLGIGLTTLIRACNSTTNTCTMQVFIISYAQNTLQRLAHLRPEGELMRRSKLPDCSYEFFILIFLFLIRCNSQTTQATELIQTRTQIAPPIYYNLHLSRKAHDTYMYVRTIRVSKNSDSFLQHLP